MGRSDEDFLIVWLDQSIDDSWKPPQSVSVHRRFTELESTMTFLASIRYEQVLLVLSGKFVDEALSRIADLRVIQDVYVIDDRLTCHTKLDSKLTSFSSHTDLTGGP